jgi:hypothetical protein
MQNGKLAVKNAQISRLGVVAQKKFFETIVAIET